MTIINPSIKQLIESGWSLVPCKKNEKFNSDTDILTRDYVPEDFTGDGNVAVNNEKTNLIDWDCDDHWSKLVSREMLSSVREASTIERYPIDDENFIETTHYLFTKNPDIDWDSLNLERKDLNGKKIIELRPKGITVIPPSITPDKETKKLYKRKWGLFNVRPTALKNILSLWNWANFSSFLLPLIHSTNTGMLKLDACLKRYCDVSDLDRENFLYKLYKIKYPDKIDRDKDLTRKAIRRVIKANNNDETKTAGYKALAQHFKIDPKEMKERLNWVGDVPDDIDGKKGKKTIVDFYENSLDIKQILKTDFPPVNWVVQDILPEGFGLLAGRPKAMKSWTALDLVYKVQNSLIFLDNRTITGDCLYLALEDNPRRLKDRLVKLTYDKKNIQHPTILTEAPYLNQGLEESIQLWTEQVSNPRLVVIDTLAKVKKTYGRNNNTAYDKDSEMLRDIQKIAMKLNITIMAISHLGKNNFDYDWDRIQGSTGMQGISDFFWMLDRGDNGDTAFLKGRGRDMEDFEFGLKWNENTFRYEFEGTLVNVLMNATKKEIIEAMQMIQLEECQPKDVCSQLAYTKQKDKSRIAKTMQRMREKMELDYGITGKGYYMLPKDLRPKERINFEADKVN